MTAPAPWYIEAFREGYLRLYPHRDLSAARGEVRFLVDHGIHGRVLDLCCGSGRHTFALHEAGLDVTGIDLSPELLSHALASEVTAPIRARLLRADVRSLPFRAGVFDSAVNLFSSFGYFGEDGDRRVLLEFARVLAPGGQLVIDLMNPARVRANLVPYSRSERDGVVLVEQRSLVADGRLVVKDVELCNASGRVRWREEVRLYEPDEMRRWLDAAGLACHASYGDFDGSSLLPDSPRQILFATRVRE